MNVFMSEVISYILSEARHEDDPIICDRDLVVVMKIISPFIMLYIVPLRICTDICAILLLKHTNNFVLQFEISRTFFICLVKESLFSTCLDSYLKKNTISSIFINERAF